MADADARLFGHVDGCCLGSWRNVQIGAWSDGANATHVRMLMDQSAELCEEYPDGIATLHIVRMGSRVVRVREQDLEDAIAVNFDEVATHGTAKASRPSLGIAQSSPDNEEGQ